MIICVDDGDNWIIEYVVWLYTVSHHLPIWACIIAITCS